MTNRDRVHKELLAKKYDKLETLQALVKTCESQPELDVPYVSGLRKRIRILRVQIGNMQP